MLSHIPAKSYVVITSTHGQEQNAVNTLTPSRADGHHSRETSSVFAIPTIGGQNEDFNQLIATRLNPTWAFRQTMHVFNGLAFEVGDFHIKIGEVKQGQGGTQQLRGTVVEVDWVGGGNSEWETAEEVIKAFWAGLDIAGGKGYFRSRGMEMGFENVQVWCEALRLR